MNDDIEDQQSDFIYKLMVQIGKLVERNQQLKAALFDAADCLDKADWFGAAEDARTVASGRNIGEDR